MSQETSQLPFFCFIGYHSSSVIIETDSRRRGKTANKTQSKRNDCARFESSSLRVKHHNARDIFSAESQGESVAHKRPISVLVMKPQLMKPQQSSTHPAQTCDNAFEEASHDTHSSRPPNAAQSDQNKDLNSDAMNSGAMNNRDGSRSEGGDARAEAVAAASPLPLTVSTEKKKDENKPRNGKGAARKSSAKPQRNVKAALGAQELAEHAMRTENAPDIEKALEESEARYRALLDAIPDLVIRVRRDGTYSDFSPSPDVPHFQKLDDLVGKNAREALPPGVARQALQQVREALKTGETQMFEHRLEVDGATRLYESRTVADGPDETLVLVRDITERRQAEDDLRQTQARFQTFMDNSPTLVFLKDAQGRFLYLNKTFEETLNVKLDDLEGKTDFAWLSPDAAARVRLSDRIVLESGVMCRAVESVPLPDGTARDWLTLKFQVPDGAGDYCVGGVAIDITERVEATRALQEANDQFHAVLDAVPGGVSWIDSDLNYLGINKFLADSFELKPEDFIGKQIGFLDASPGFNAFVRSFFQNEETSDSHEVMMTIKGEARMFLIMGQKYQNGASGVFVGIDITDHKRVEASLRHGAYHDALTDLPNRAFFRDKLEGVISLSQRREEYQFAVLFLDFDRFKIINDSLGHNIGDQLLIHVAHRLESCLRPNDTIARLGGDEFTVLLEDIKDISEVTRVANRILQSMEQSIPLEGHEIYTSVSIGIALGEGQYERAEDIMRDADTALYRAKGKGRARYEIFDTVMHAQVMARLQMETDLRHALDGVDSGKPEFRVYYQTIVSLKTDQIMGLEALVRWEHPQRGLILPADFMPVAVETGLIVPLDKWVMREACRRMRSWHRTLPNATPLQIVVNLSSRCFAQLDLLEQIEMTLADCELEARYLRLEITESVLMENAEIAAATIEKLDVMGVTLGMDGFGTGYSSLNSLYRFPLQTIKIDRTLVGRIGTEPVVEKAIEEQAEATGEEPEEESPGEAALRPSVVKGRADKHAEIVRAIVALSHNLGIEVVAEGVETEDQLIQLRELGCDYVQGYLFSHPGDSLATGQLIGDG